MTSKYDSLELAVLNLMRTDAAYRIENELTDDAQEKLAVITPHNFHEIINNVVSCQLLELAITLQMLTREGLLRMEFNEKTGAEEGYSITKEGLVALRSMK